MIVDRIKYSKLFNLGSFQNETIGLEAVVEKDDDRMTCFAQLHQEVDRMHRAALDAKTEAVAGQKALDEWRKKSKNKKIKPVVSVKDGKDDPKPAD